MGVAAQPTGAMVARLPRVPAPRAKEEPAVPALFKVGAWIAFVVLLLPVVIVVLAGLNAGDYLTFPPDGLSLRWIWAFLGSETFMGAYLFSLWLAVLTMVLSTVLGTLAAIFLARLRFPGRNLLRAYFVSPLILPGVVLGLALYGFYVSADLGLARTLPGLVIGHVLVTCPYVIGTVSAALFHFDLSLEEAARSLGAGPLYAFRKVTLPSIAPGVMAGSIFAFIVSFGQFDVSLFLSTPNLTPLPIAMYISLRYKFEPTAAAAGIFAIALVVVSMALTSRLISLKRFAGIKFG
jgi:putative spermidine/putrescine transport system permease protein